MQRLTHPERRPARIVIAGGGVAALETLLALRARSREPVEIELIAPERDFTWRALEVGEPFGLGAPQRHRLEDLASRWGATLRRDVVTAVRPQAHRLRTGSGADARYDALVLATGARAVPVYEHGVTFDRGLDPESFDDVLGDAHHGLVQSIAFVVPAELRWTLPAYELALMTRAWAELRDRPQPAVTLITHEEAPLEAFGHRASEAAADALRDADVEVVTARTVEIATDAAMLVRPPGRWRIFDRIVALPGRTGPDIAGIPRDARGFVPVDEHGRVHRLEDVFAAGDATSGAMKQGGLAAAQACCVAAAVAARIAGSDPGPRPPALLRGILRTPEGPLYLSVDPRDPWSTSTAGREPLWSPATKVATTHLGPALAELEAAETRAG